MDGLRVEAPAKVNMALDITGIREDGYHLMRMINFSVDLEDELILEPANDLFFECDTPGIPSDASNLVMRIALALKKRYGVHAGARMILKKAIPAQAGLAGGSADGAAALMGLNRLWGLELPLEELTAFGAGIGADIPYCCFNRPALVEGIGDVITPLDNFPSFAVLGVKPPVAISTPWAFARMDERGIAAHPDMDGLVQAIRRGDEQAVIRKAANVFEPMVFEAYPAVGAIRDSLLDQGALFSVMSGSGSTVIGYFRTAEEASRCRQAYDNGKNVTFVAEIR